MQRTQSEIIYSAYSSSLQRPLCIHYNANGRILAMKIMIRPAETNSAREECVKSGERGRRILMSTYDKRDR